MKYYLGAIASITLTFALAASAATIPGDAGRGAELFQSQKCVSCHSVDGEGGKSAPDLARRPYETFTPASLAAAIWNHAPQMWAAMADANVGQPRPTVQQSADLFAFFFAHRYSEKPGDAGRGKHFFESKGCNGCHGRGTAGAKPITEWESSGDPIQFAQALWNHAPRMKAAMGADADWPVITAQELTDLSVYVRNAPGARRPEREFSPASAETGETLFQAKGCAGCHTGNRTLAGRKGGRSLAAFAAAMWNHAPEMRPSAKELRPEEMTRLVGYLWSIQYFDEPGNASRGQKVLADKQCGTCHGVSGSGAPEFSSLAGKLDAIEFVSATWTHGPEMLERMRRSDTKWPLFKNRELNDLLAYINSL